jgi:2,4-dienoyl-CoA reductase-like NADH-dependent reductase (Old Yellow Enzyme family)
MPSSLLFEPIELRDVRANNRVVVSPMCQYSAAEGVVHDWHLVHLGKFAQGGAGIVFVEATAVEARGAPTRRDSTSWRSMPRMATCCTVSCRRFPTGARTATAAMAVGLILTPRQAEEALQAGRADLIAIGREALFNPNWPLHAALELGADAEFASWPQPYGWWLTRREASLQREGIVRRAIDYPMRSG